MVHWWLILISNLLVNQQSHSLNVLLIDWLWSIRVAWNDGVKDSEEGLVEKDKDEGGEDTGGDAEEDWVQDDGDAGQDAMVMATEVVGAELAILVSVWSSVVWATVVHHHIWVWATVWSSVMHHLSMRTTMAVNAMGRNSRGVLVTVTSSLQGLCAVHNLALDDGDSEAESLDAVVCSLLDLASSGVASNTTAWMGTKDADLAVADSIDMVNNLERSKIDNLAANGFDGDVGVVDADWLIDGVGNFVIIDVELDRNRQFSFLLTVTMANLGDEGAATSFLIGGVDCDVVDGEEVAVSLDSEDLKIPS